MPKQELVTQAQDKHQAVIDNIIDQLANKLAYFGPKDQLIENILTPVVTEVISETMTDEALASVQPGAAVPPPLKTENETKLVAWLFDTGIVEGQDIDGGELQEKLEKLGYIEERAVDPKENEFEAETMYFLVGDEPEEANPKTKEKK